MKPLTKEQAEKFAQMTSSIFVQGNSWVMKELDLTLGTEKLTRGLTEKSAQKRLKKWRRECIEELLRNHKETLGYVLRVWHENPDWDGGGTWHWAQKHWYTTIEDAKNALEKIQATKPLEIKELKIAEIPGNFSVA